ncbi:hypothetical protein CROQUDRAFT_653311 [Cronartium quercuum f. sp. fusiforme G11]|uniref:Dihydrolipoamide acetyltransferase component of pyruvate dehydrogenase complex n=1 Tax=Cronartium quercuum f. sp. fusiforme G11 TaxID=708437 RepID=A0A9P6NT43_9BASI|nr:hypothetical protein CROQUDRAFT_653311 [Cronartium quercuum f. sp. fusiforme G11]
MLVNGAVRLASCGLNGARLPCHMVGSRIFHSCSYVRAITPLRMPALSPTMEAGQISRWNLEPGARFSAGDILLTVETDKAEVDVEAQDDGYMGPQLVSARTSIKVGEVIAVLGEEAGDVSEKVEVPETWKSSGDSAVPRSTQSSEDKVQSRGTSDGACASSSSDHKQYAGQYANLHPTAKMPLSPAVTRILIENQIGDATGIKATGLNGRLTKGDVLHHLGIVSSPVGSAQKMFADDAHSRTLEKSSLSLTSSIATQLPPLPLDGPALRRCITAGLAITSRSVAQPKLLEPSPTFDSILGEYHRSLPLSTHTFPIPSSPVQDSYLEGLGP